MITPASTTDQAIVATVTPTTLTVMGRTEATMGETTEAIDTIPIKPTI